MKIILRVAFVVLCTLATFGETLPIVKSVGPLIITEIDGFKFLIDTGSNANFIDSKSLEKFKEKIVRVEKRDKFVNTFAGKSKSESYDLTFKVGKIDFKDMETYVMNTDKFNVKNDGIECCDGILGMPFLKKHPVIIDLAKKEITIKEKLNITDSKDSRVLDFKIKGKDTIVISCQVNKVKVNLRLDTGSEAPLIFHKPAVDKFHLREQMFLQDYRGNGLPFFTSDDFKCGENKFENIVSTYFYGQGGALTHREVEGNLGAYILGDRYVFDFEKSKIYISKKELNFSYTGTIYKASLAFDSAFKGHASINSQALGLMLNSCAELSDVDSCMMKLCELEKKSICTIRSSKSIVADYINYYFPVRTPDCSTERLVNELRSNPVQYNFCWYKLFELNQKKMTLEESTYQLPSKFKELESEVSLKHVNNIYDFTKNYYCLAVFNEIFAMENLPPSLFAFSVKGLSFGSESVSDYQKWIVSSEGLKCSNEVKSTLGDEAVKKIDELTTKKYFIKINPWTFIGDGIEKYDQNLNRTTLHELLHIIYAKYAGIKANTKKKWLSLSGKEQEKFRKSHKDYNFDNEEILLREYFAYGHENGEEVSSSLMR